MKPILILAFMWLILSFNLFSQNTSVSDTCFSQNETLWMSYEFFENRCAIQCNGQLDSIKTSLNTIYDVSLNGSVLDSLSGLCAGDYNILLVDTNTNENCSLTFAIQEVTPLLVDISTTNVTNINPCDGTATIEITGGISPYSYFVMDEDSNLISEQSLFLDSLCIGNYIFAYSDGQICGNYCAQCDSVVMDTCNNEINGALDSYCLSGYQFMNFGIGGDGPGGTLYIDCFLNANYNLTGVAPFTINILNNGEIVETMVDDNHTGSISNFQGESIEIIDAIGQTTIIEGFFEFYFPFTVSATNESCANLCDGTISPDYAEYYLINGNIFTFSDVQDSLFCPGVYEVEAFVGSCNSVFTVEIFAGDSPELQLISVLNASDANTSDGVVVVSANEGVPGYIYSIENNENEIGEFTDLNPGNYTVYVYDSLGCSDSIDVEIVPCEIDVYIKSKSNARCDGVCNGVIELETQFSNGSMEYEWMEVESDSNILSELCIGNYTCLVRDEFGCEDSIEVDIEASLTLLLDIIPDEESTDDLSFNLQGKNGEGPYSFSFDGGITWTTETHFNNLEEGEYEICVKDFDGCIACYEHDLVASVWNDSDEKRINYWPNPVVDLLYIQNNQNVDWIKCFNLQGQELSVNSTIQGENAILDLSLLPIGSYAILIYSNGFFTTMNVSVNR